MTRVINVILACVLVAAAIGVYSIKYEATLQSEKVSKLRRAIDAEHVAINTLKAEWAFLVQPERLTELARAHTDLKPMQIQQVVKAGDLPAKSADDEIGKKLQGLGLGDPLVTGSVQ